VAHIKIITMDSSHIPLALPDQTVPAPLQGRADRRQFLRTVGRAGLAALLSPGLLPARSGRAQSAQQPLIQPPELRSRNGELRVTLTAAPTSMRLGDVEFPGFL
jgi:hypothetical protein